MNRGNPKILAIMVQTKGWQDMDRDVKSIIRLPTAMEWPGVLFLRN